MQSSERESSELLFAAVADDDTGASDLAGMFAEQNVRTLLVIDLPETERLTKWSRGYQAIVIAEATRNLAPEAAYERTREAIRLLENLRPRVFQIKYCSTFDSTGEGNIGATINAAMDALGEGFTIALPALPVNGRTTYQGYHFVHQQLLSDSPMRDHPLTPMTNPNLVNLLGQQTKRKVGLASYADVEAGAERLYESFRSLCDEGIKIAVVDCLNDAHLETICRATCDFRLITGSSAFGMKLPEIWRERGLLDTHENSSQREENELKIHNVSKGGRIGCLIIAGSCSAATREQNARFIARGAAFRKLTAQELLSREFDRASLVKEAREEISSGGNFWLTTSGEPEEVRQAQSWAREKGLRVPAFGEKLAYALVDLSLEIIENCAISGLIAAGGETSGALCRKLNLGALRVGRNIAPGVPLCYSLGRFQFPVALKSGNFGGENFYEEAIRAVMNPEKFLI